MCPLLNGFRDTDISLYRSKFVDKKEILHTVSNTGIYCSSDKVGTVKASDRIRSLVLFSFFLYGISTFSSSTLKILYTNFVERQAKFIPTDNGIFLL
jgi:hypothetical protein